MKNVPAILSKTVENFNDINYIPECESLYFEGLSPVPRASKHYISEMKYFCNESADIAPTSSLVKGSKKFGKSV